MHMLHGKWLFKSTEILSNTRDLDRIFLKPSLTRLSDIFFSSPQNLAGISRTWWSKTSSVCFNIFSKMVQVKFLLALNAGSEISPRQILSWSCHLIVAFWAQGCKYLYWCLKMHVKLCGLCFLTECLQRHFSYYAIILPLNF